MTPTINSDDDLLYNVDNEELKRNRIQFNE